jgi:hypothetical protein
MFFDAEAAAFSARRTHLFIFRKRPNISGVTALVSLFDLPVQF